jgi:spermidine synthase
LARYIGGPKVVEHYLAQEPVRPNTDDRNQIEYGFARSLGQRGRFPALDLRRAATEIQGQRPPNVHGEVDWASVARQWRELYAARGRAVLPASDTSAADARRCQALAFVAQRNWAQAIDCWQTMEPASPTELALVAWALAERGDPRGAPLVERLRSVQPTEADAIQGILLWRQRKMEPAAQSLASAFRRLRADPWPWPELMAGALEAALLVSHADPRLAPELFAAMEQPFAQDYADGLRRRIACRTAALFQHAAAVRSIESFEPRVPWTRSFLKLRQQEYAAVGHPLAAQAARDFAEFTRQEDVRGN